MKKLQKVEVEKTKTN